MRSSFYVHYVSHGEGNIVVMGMLSGQDNPMTKDPREILYYLIFTRAQQWMDNFIARTQQKKGVKYI